MTWRSGALVLLILPAVAAAGCEIFGRRSANIVQPEQRLSVGQDAGGDATSIVFQFVEGYGGGLAGAFAVAVLLLLIRRARINAAIAERLVLAIERADDGKVKKAVREAGAWTHHDRVEKALAGLVGKITGGSRASNHPQPTTPPNRLQEKNK